MQKNSIMICDTSVLINFLRINRIDLITALNYKILITEEVTQEILKRFEQQYQVLQKSLEEGCLTEVIVNKPQELEIFSQLVVKLGRGESSAIAYALHNDCILLIDDKKAIKEAQSFNKALRIMNTQSLISFMVNKGILSAEQENELIANWASHHRFKISQGSKITNKI